jgi:hypothetical protein
MTGEASRTMLVKTLKKPGFWVLLAFIAIYLIVHFPAAYTFPVPWPDESVFLWQAISVREANSLLAPQLNPERPILWMPPGYMLLAGLTFKVFGFSFDLARLLSLLFVVATFVVLGLMASRYRHATLAALFCGLGLLSRQFIAAGNVARMEALLLLVVCGGFLLLQRNQFYKGLALLGLSPLVHPNGFYFLVAAIAYLLLSGRFGPRRPALRRADAAIVLVAIALWLAYALYAGRHWPDFVHDISYQLGRKGTRDVLTALFTENNLFFLLLFFFALVYGLKEKLGAVFFLWLAGPAWLVNKIGREMWYQVFDVLAYVLLSIVLLHVILHLADSLTRPRSKPVRYAVGAGALALLILLGLASGLIVKPIGFPWSMSWVGMGLAPDVAYVQEDDIAEVGAFISSLPSGDGPTWVQFYPRADALFFYPIQGDLPSEGIQFSHPLFYTRKPDLYIIHLSRHTPHWLSARVDQAFQTAGLDPTDEAQIVWRRDETEIWYFGLAQE